MTRDNIDLEEEDSQIEECEWKISGHDVPDPVPADMMTLDTGKAIGISQGIVIDLTPPTQCSSPVHTITHVVI